MVCRIISLLVPALLVGCTFETNLTSDQVAEKEQKPASPPVVRIVNDEIRKAPLKTDVQCWNEPCTENGMWHDPEKAPLIETRPGSDIRISFSDPAPYDIIFLQSGPEKMRIRTATEAKILELAGPEEEGTYFIQIHATWNNQGNSGQVVYMFRLRVEQ
ncbi:hypothetical protein [Desmospora activa]|uniref:Lipoprotein n=1 Tax=Desmospora activa DSM 45169 TaxID=1121389 RepID=A0A2T4ZBK6_9BACL|nr:hypothetical protein [Desmospora activa]PTM59284.1 hypothetical protein C8J48_1891 [Desmospora activa DSM 45169]